MIIISPTREDRPGRLAGISNAHLCSKSGMVSWKGLLSKMVTSVTLDPRIPCVKNESDGKTSTKEGTFVLERFFRIDTYLSFNLHPRPARIIWSVERSWLREDFQLSSMLLIYEHI